MDAADESEGGGDGLKAKAASVVATLGVLLIQAVVFIYDFVTYPIYFFVQQPWKQVRQDVV